MNLLAKKTLAFIVISFFISFIGFFLHLLIQEVRPFIEDGQKITGTVIDVVFERDKQIPVVEYYTLAGTKYTYRHKDGALFRDYYVGDSVEITYLPNDPIKCQLAGFNIEYFFIFFLGTFNLFLIAYLYALLSTNDEGGPHWIKYFFAMTWGLWFFGGGYMAHLDTQYFMKNAEEAIGTVIGERYKICTRKKKKGGKEKYDCYSYSIHFLTKESKRTTYETGYGRSRREVGDRVKLLYNKRNPVDARIDSKFARQGIGWLFMGIGGVVFLIGLVGLIRGWK